MILRHLACRLRQRFGSFLLKEKNMQPALYFLMLAYLQYPFETSHHNYDQPLFYFAVLVALITNFNFLFTLASFLQASPALALPMLAVGLFSCNQKWKLYLLILATGNRAFSGPPQQYFMATCSLLICLQIYRTLLFRTLSQNTQYFTGFAAAATYYSLSIIAENCDLDFSLQFEIIFVLATASLAHSFMGLKLQGLKKEEPEHIYNGRIMAHYLKTLQEDTKNTYLLQTRILFHNRNCRKNNCFCHSKEHNHKTEYLLRQLYQNALQKFKNDNDFLLFENYVDFLLRNEQAINALYFLGNWKPQGFFSLVGRQRAKARVQRVLRDANSSNLYELQYEYALEYDHHYQRVATEINQILKLKLQFWGEVSRETPKLHRMQRLGAQIIHRMHELNIFYNSVIKGYQRSLFLFDTTALYAMYMLSTTNFKEYAELIIKNTAKLLQEVYVFQNNSSETFAIRTVVRRQKDSYIDHPRDNLKALRHMSTSHTFVQINDSTCCKLIIDAVSSGLCNIINIKRSQLIGRELNSIIPDGYKEVHNVRLSYLLDFQSDTLKEIVPSKVMHKQLKLPIKCENDKLAMGYVCIKFIVDLVQGLSFISVVKLSRDRSSHVLMDFNGRVTQSEDGFNKEILQHSEIQRYLQRLRDSWQSEKVIPEQRFNLMINTANYGITISSPLLGLFLEKQNLKEKCPPIHLQITNEQATRNHTVQTDKYNKIGMQIKQMQKAINTYDAESSTSNSKSGSSAVTIINNFSETSSTPIYRFIQIAFLASILTCILSNLGAYFTTNLSWDVTSPTYNPLNDTMNLYAIQMLTIKAVLTYGDVQSYINLGNALNKTRISQYYGNGSYETSISEQISEMETALKDSVLNCLATPSQLLQPYINQRFSVLLAVLNPATVDQLLNTSTKSQNLTYLSLLMVYSTDLNLLGRFDIDSPVMKYSYSVQVASTQNCSFLSPIIDSAVQHSQTIAVAVHLALMVVISLLLIPLKLLLRKRLSLHEKVFDLLVSIDAQQVTNQIHSLEYICNILRNSKQSNEIMKMNVLGYEQNVIHPKGLRRSSSDNEMVLGLEKYDTSIQNFEITVSRPPLEHSPQLGDSRNSNKRKTQILNENLATRTNKMNTNSVLGLIKKSYLNTQQQRSENIRKRSGQLDLSGSLLDPSNKLITEHCFLYLVSLSFLLLLGLSIHFKMRFDSEYLRGKEHLLATYTDQITFEKRLLEAKVMLITGSDFYSKFFGTSTAPDLFVPIFNAFPTYNHYDGMDIYAQIKRNCSENTPLSPNFLAKYCQYDYSEVVLKGQFGSLLKQLMELRYMADKKLTNLNFSATILNITERIYYLESLNLRLEELVLKKVAILFDSIVDLGQSFQKTKDIILIASVLWGILCFILGFWMVVRMKQSYFKQVFMITFLNNEMILKNKRVESFLELIAKSASA